MSNYRLASNHEFFLRDLLRDYCIVYLALDEQVQRYRRDGSISFSVLQSLVGESLSKGVFWRLKDTAHFLFRNEEGTGGPQYAGTGRLVDWCVGYAFHECCKLREDAFQGQHYAMRLTQLCRADAQVRDMASPLIPLLDQTAESCARELTRILHVLREGMRLLVCFLPSASGNCSLARWLVTDRDRARHAFDSLYPDLIHALYEDSPERMYTLAAVDFMECGRTAEARYWLSRAQENDSLDEDGEHMLRALESVETETATA